MRYLMPLLLVGCGSIQHVEEISDKPVTCEQGFCIQEEMQCLEKSSEGSSGVWLVLFTASESTTGPVIVRHCQLQGELCRLRKCAPKPAAAQADPADAGR